LRSTTQRSSWIPLGLHSVASSAQRYHGHEGVRRFYRAYDEAWAHIDYDIEELIDAGDHVVSIVNIRAHGRVSGVEVELRMSGVWTIQERRIIRVVYFQTRDEALKAAELSE
jgi:ketosteroid isomerase-like protein